MVLRETGARALGIPSIKMKTIRDSGPGVEGRREGPGSARVMSRSESVYVFPIATAFKAVSLSSKPAFSCSALR